MSVDILRLGRFFNRKDTGTHYKSTQTDLKLYFRGKSVDPISRSSPYFVDKNLVLTCYLLIQRKLYHGDVYLTSLTDVLEGNEMKLSESLYFSPQQ